MKKPNKVCKIVKCFKCEKDITKEWKEESGFCQVKADVWCADNSYSGNFLIPMCFYCVSRIRDLVR